VKIDLEALLTPISADRPSGESLRYSGLYEAVEEARREDDPSLPQGVWKTDLKRADWKEAARLCLDALETRSKDLQVAAWLLEAWIHLEGVPGATRGLSLLGALCESFWDTVHPLPQDGDVEFRLAPLEWVAGRIPDAVRGIPITSPGTSPGEEARPCTYADLDGARHMERLARTDPQAAQTAETQGRISTDRFLVSVSLTPTAFYSVLEADARQALAALDAVAALLNRLCGNDAPSFQRLGDALFAVQHFALRVLEERRDRGEEIAGPMAGAGTPGMDEMDFYPQAEEEEGAFYGGTPIRSRAEAYRRLAEAADYLLRTEPHSPTPYLVRRAVAWGGMSLGELLEELVQSDNDLKSIYTLLGMRERP